MANPLISTNEKSPAVYMSGKWKKFFQAFTVNRNNTDAITSPIFNKYTNIYTLCCVIGYQENKRKKLEQKDSLFTLEQIDQELEWPILIAIAWLSSDKDLGVLESPKMILEICSEYAEAGIEILSNLKPFADNFEDGTLTIGTKLYNEFGYDLILEMRNLKEKYSNELFD